ncbi:MAG: energy transducer TonB [Bacteroidota bacterium]
MEEVLTPQELANKRKGQIAGGIMFILLMLMLFFIRFWYQNPPPGQEGIQVNLGIPDIGMGDDLTAPPAAVSEPIAETQPEPEPVEETTPPPPTEPEPTPEPVVEDVVTTEDPAAIALRKRQEREQRERAEERREQERRDREAREQAERERREREAREARERAEAQRKADAQNTRDQIGGLFGSGGGGGNTNRPGDGGATNGDPSSTNLGNKSFGSGTVGGGLGSRGVSNSPRLVENSQESGTVVVRLCVNANGSVDASSVQITQSGTTTTSSQLRNAAIRNAKSWRFTEGSADRQCGTITYNFSVR